MALVYSCCFWFSLRLGGIIIALFSLGVLLLIGCCFAYTHAELVNDKVKEWNNNMNLIYYQEYLENVVEDPIKYISFSIGVTCVYVIACIVYIYGAFLCNNILMLAYIILELIRLIMVSAMVATGLLLLKQNTMDIGSLIGASVVAGFFLLGMFYLWVCAANLPILINEMYRDEQAATIAKLQQFLETNQRPRARFDNVGYAVSEEPSYGRGAFVIPNRSRGFERLTTNRSNIPVPY